MYIIFYIKISIYIDLYIHMHITYMNILLRTCPFYARKNTEKPARTGRTHHREGKG